MEKLTPITLTALLLSASLLNGCTPSTATSNIVAITPAPATFTSDRLSVEVVGKGPDVILIPGLSSTPDVWKSTVAAVPGYRYHLVHVNGFAGKPVGGNASGPFLDPVASEIARYITTKNLKAPTLVGHSLGGSLAMRVATQHPESVGKLMVVDMFPFMGLMFGGPQATSESVKPAAEAVHTGIITATGDARKTKIEKTIAGMVKTENMRAEAVEDSLTSDQAVSAQAMYDLIITDLRPDLPKFKGPMEVLWVYPPGAPVAEPVYEQFFIQSYKGAPQAVVKQVPDAYHFLMWDNPTAWQAELKAFLAK